MRVSGSPPQLGLGIGWREPLARLALELEDLGFVEVVAESVEIDHGVVPFKSRESELSARVTRTRAASGEQPSDLAASS